MAQTIKLKRSATSGAVPTTGSLELGEVAINTYDGKMYIKKNDGTESVVEIGDTSEYLPLSGGTLTGNVSFGDNVKATFGASSDLQIYHDGSNSYIANVGSGSLIIQDTDGSGDIYIRPKSGQTAIAAYNDNTVQLAHSGNVKLSTISTGIDVTGTATMDGLTVETAQGDISIANSSSSLNFARAGFNYLRATDASGSFSFITGANNYSTQRLNIASNGDISFYNNSGAAKLIWDASAESLGIGTSSPIAPITIKSSSTSGSTSGLLLQGNSNTNTIVAIGEKSTDGGRLHMYDGGVEKIAFYTDGTSNHISAGNVGIGTTTPIGKLSVSNNGAEGIEFFPASANGLNTTQHYNRSAAAYVINKIIASDHRFNIGGNEKVRIDSAGNLLVGTTNANNVSDGIRLKPDGFISAANTSGPVLYANRLSTDGSILSFQKDGATVGSIGTYVNLPYIGKADVNLLFDPTGPHIIPRGTNGGARDAAINLGASANRFKDLYLSGSARASSFVDSGNTANYIDSPTSSVFRLNGSSGFVLSANGSTIVTGNSGGIDVTGITKVSGTVDEQLVLNSTDNGPVYMSFKRSDDRHAYFGFGSSNDLLYIMNEEASGELSFGTASVERMRINSAGAVTAYNSLRAPIFYDSGNTSYYTDPAGTSRMANVAADKVYVSANAANKIGFWNGTTNYTIGMSQATDATNGGRVAGETTSDYNMYFTMSAGTNRGFVFRNNNSSGSAVAGIDAGGNARFNGSVGVNGSTAIDSSRNLTNIGNITSTADNSFLSMGVAGAGSAVGGRYLSIEGNTDTSGEGSGRIFFTEHNSTTAAMDNYGMSIGYRGGQTTVEGASGNTWDGLGQIGNGEWGMWGHNNSASGSLIMYGDRAASFINFAGNGLDGVGRVRFSDTSPTLQEDNNYLRIQTASGWTNIGSGNSSWSHFFTDRGGFYFGTKVNVNGEIRVYNTSSVLNSAGAYAPAFYDSDDTAFYVNPASTSNVKGFIFNSGTTLVQATPNIESLASNNTAGNVHYHATFCRNDGTVNGKITTNYYATTYSTTSDYRVKEDIQPMGSATADLMALNPINFQWVGSDIRTDGFLAHEVAAIVPDAVVGEKDSVDAKGNPDLQGLDQSKMVPLLVKTIQEQQAAIQALEARITALENA